MIGQIPEGFKYKTYFRNGTGNQSMLQIGQISEGFKLKTYFRNGTLMLQIDQISEGFKMLIEKPTAVSFMQTIGN